ncbi:uncharacterized protein LOC142768829 isoform X1 [Rhipicephalus microplus]|uniref:uncharacterized protein LOC142768829 isoform X1 n=1 Tax=Rhipicephalus microplus TaxID=6941 RepID=UPI003F6D0E8D
MLKFLRQVVIFQVIFYYGIHLGSRQVAADQKVPNLEEKYQNSSSAWEFVAGYGKHMFVQYRNFNTTNSSCIMATRMKLDESTHRAEYRTRWYNLTAAKPLQIKSLYSTEGQILTATQCYPFGGNSRKNYTIIYTDSSCAVVVVEHEREAAADSPNPCEMWVRSGSRNTWNKACDSVYKEECGTRKTTVYNKKYCRVLIRSFAHETKLPNPSNKC